MRGQLSAAVAAVVLACASTTQAVVIETVGAGNLGNASDTRYESPGYGGVDYFYQIGKFEVTAGQYVEFLNAVAATDTHWLYNRGMDITYAGCQITQNGTSGSYTYDFSGRHHGTEADLAARPVTDVSWADAARFCNWMHNGQPTGARDSTTTEDGSYYLNGALTDDVLLGVVREPDATWVIPSEDEWYKAAYHKNDGVTGNYWDYPMQSDTVPTSEPPAGTDMTNGSANCYGLAMAVGKPHYRTKVGAYDFKPSDSPYGTFDQGGNVWEWNEVVFSGSNGLNRGLRGGCFDDYCDWGHAVLRDYYGARSFESALIGFRVARRTGQGRVPAVSEWGMVTMVLLALTAGTLVWARRGVAVV